MEGIRLNSTAGPYRIATTDTIIDDNGRKVTVKPGDRVLCSFRSANREAEFFPEPEQVRLDRPLESYINYGIGANGCLGGEASMIGLTAMLRTVGKLDNLRRIPGAPGELKKVPQSGGIDMYLRPDHGVLFPFPTSELTPISSPASMD